MLDHLDDSSPPVADERMAEQVIREGRRRRQRRRRAVGGALGAVLLFMGVIVGMTVGGDGQRDAVVAGPDERPGDHEDAGEVVTLADVPARFDDVTEVEFRFVNGQRGGLVVPTWLPDGLHAGRLGYTPSGDTLHFAAADGEHYVRVYVSADGGVEVTSSGFDDAAERRVLESLRPLAAPRRVAEQNLGPEPEGYDAMTRLGAMHVQDSGPDASQLRVAVAESGCLALDYIEVLETSSSVELAAIVRELDPHEGYGCELPLLVKVADVALSEPLGTRRVVGGCTPGDNSPDQRICAALAPN